MVVSKRRYRIAGDAMSEDKSRMPIVWVVEQGDFDYTPALVFGSELRLIVADRLSPNADPSWHAKVIQQMRKSFASYVPAYDYVIPTGRPVRMMLAAMIMRERGARHNLLGWDDKTQRYFLYELDLRQNSNLPSTHDYNRA
jgi:hypothetical protein